MNVVDLYNMDCRDAMSLFLPDNSVDAIVCDPPYGLAFMGKKWDYDVPSVEIWAECLRVLKPGGHLLAFAGTRTQHRMAVRIEDAGFEIRDMIAWVYGCLDEATEVATESGVMPYHKTKIGDRVLCYDAEHGEYTYQPILEIVEYEYSDTAYRLVGDFGEQVVSRNHRVLVERGGKEAFQLAETLGTEACVPVLESLPALQQAVRRTESKSGFAQQDMQQGVCQCADWGRKQGFDASGSAQGRDDQMRGLRNGSLEAKRLAQEDFDACLQSRVQRRSSRGRVGEPCLQGAGELEAGIGSRAEGSHDRSVEPGLEGGIDVPQSQRCVCRPADQVRSLPGVDDADGAVGRLCDGAPIIGGACDWANLDAGGVRTPHQPQRDGQQPNEPHAVRDEWIAQGVRAWGGHNTSLVRVVPFHYTGKVWCLRVPTGAFVAVRNGVAFPTGNSGFPKSLDVSKAIDKAAGAERDVVGLSKGKGGENLNNLVRDGGNDASDAKGCGAYGIGAKQITIDIPITAPATEAARQWDGWGTALKPALETVTFASKPYTDEQERDIIQSNLFRLEARLWLLSSANAAGKSSASNQSAYDAACAIAQWSADEITSTRADLCGQMGTSLFALATTTSLNIVSSWRRTLDESWSDGSTSTIETKSSTTIDWRTLKFSVSQITPASIIQACSLPGGFSANASTAESHFNASLSLLQSILTLSVTEPVISLAQHEHQGAGVTPNLDPVVLARKPLIGTVAANVLAHGTGGLNIDGCRVGDFQNTTPSGVDRRNAKLAELGYRPGEYQMGDKVPDTPPGRWPANLILSDDPEVVAVFPDSNGSGPARKLNRSAKPEQQGWGMNTTASDVASLRDAGTGSAARFFYAAKASKKDRGDGNGHPTVKPTDLMAYLCRLVTPPGGVVFDPFMGSGSTGKAALREGFGFIGCEMDAAYFAIAQARIAAVKADA